MSPSGGRNKQNIWNHHRVSHFHVWWAPPTVITWVVMAMPGGSWRIFDCPKDQRLDPPMGSGEWTCITQGCTGPQNNAGFEGSGYLRLRVLKKTQAYLWWFVPSQYCRSCGVCRSHSVGAAICLFGLELAVKLQFFHLHHHQVDSLFLSKIHKILCVSNVMMSCHALLTWW